MNTLKALILGSFFTAGMCNATVITYTTACLVYSQSLQLVASNCNDAGYVTAFVSVQFPAAGLAQTPIVFSESESASVTYPWNGGYSEALFSVDASTSLILTGPPRDIWVEGTISGSGGGVMAEPEPYFIDLTGSSGTTMFSIGPNAGWSCAYQPGDTASCDFELEMPVSGALTVEISSPQEMLEATQGPPEGNMEAEVGSQVQLSLQLFEITNGICNSGPAGWYPCPPTTPVTAYVDQTPEPATLILPLMPLGLLLAWRLRARL